MSADDEILSRAPVKVGCLRRLVDRHFLVLVLLAMPLIGVGNYQAVAQQGMTDYFRDFADIIRAGFDPSVAVRKGVPTFPMWGYGWLMALTQFKPALLAIQGGIAFLAVAVFVRTLRRTELVTPNQLTAVRILLLLSVPWYAYHLLTWPGSISTSLGIIALCLLADFPAPNRQWMAPIIASGLLLGLGANFRSDVLLMPLAVAPVLLLAARLRPYSFGRLAVWMASTYLMIVPWAIYSRHVAGHFLLTSTNGGLTALTGFGQLGPNCWDITLSDEDPTVQRWLYEQFGTIPSPVSFHADRFLKQKFREVVLQQPSEYVRKVLKTLVLHVTGGTYPGEFFRWLADDWKQANAEYLEIRKDLRSNPLQAFRTWGPAVLLVILQLGSSLFGKIVVFLSFCLLPVVVVHGWRARKALYLCFLAAIVYKALVVAMLGNAAPRFSAIVFPFHLMNVVLGGTILLRFARNRLVRPAEERAAA